MSTVLCPLMETPDVQAGPGFELEQVQVWVSKTQTAFKLRL